MAPNGHLSAPGPGLIRCRAVAEIEIVVDVDVATEQSFADDIIQAIQNEIGHTGAKVEDVTDWMFLMEEPRG